MMESGRLFRGSLRIELEAVLQDPGVLKILILNHLEACGVMLDQEEPLAMPGRHIMLILGWQLAEGIQDPKHSTRVLRTIMCLRILSFAHLLSMDGIGNLELVLIQPRVYKMAMGKTVLALRSKKTMILKMLRMTQMIMLLMSLMMNFLQMTLIQILVKRAMVMIMNTQLEQDENDKWIGMGNQELLDYFSSYAAVKARHSYGPHGHRGMSVLIFESTARGYLEAERLHKHFAEQGTDREAWERRRVLFHPGGKRQLYGYMAIKEDLDSFNQHCQGKFRLKFDMRSYQEMVVQQIRQMSEDNQQLIFYKNKVAKERRLKSALQESLGIVREKLLKTVEENRIVRQRTKMQHEQNKEEMDFQEQFFKEQIKFIHEARDEKEEDFEKLQQQEREKVTQSNPNASNTEEYRRRASEIAKFIKFQNEEMEAFVAERDKLIKVHEEKMTAMRQRHWNEEVELEKEFDSELSHLMEKYTPDSTKVSTKNA
ncbi:XS domain-containing protein / XS zinc finger domain-containing protein-related isoform 2 [Theobroma cacao]|uniref:XS domain-containing protein / XS zinc finger domain-containing protein-related isoform 2 n=1 Tax=Theobroma cacao TaxID=3641 RepID=A0A061DK74_THECC|nr:XS domain-containing protein / XS zinc finger domain-containing protein-related isoform 2 [Theobroma cacao]